MITGNKYVQGRDVKEIAKDVRADIKKAVAAGYLPATKYSVTISRFAGGRSLDIRASHPTFAFGTASRKSAATFLKGITDAYNFDGSDIMTDYFHVNFYSSINLGVSNDEQSMA